MPGELVSRIKAHLRRRNNFSASFFENEENIYIFDNLKIDFDAYKIHLDNHQVNIITKGCEILKMLLENSRKTFSATQILETVWKTMCIDNDTRTVMVYIRNLRKKIETLLSQVSPMLLILFLHIGT